MLDFRRDMLRIRDWILPPVRHTVSSWGAAPHQFQSFLNDVAESVDAGVRPFAKRRNLRVKGFPKDLKLGSFVPNRTPTLISWDGASWFRPRFRVEIRQVLPDLSQLELTGRIWFPAAVVLSVAIGVLFELLFWPPPNIFRPWNPVAIAAVLVPAVVFFLYSLRIHGVTSIQLSGLIAGGVALGGYVLWPLWLGMGLGFVVGLQSSKMRHEASMRAGLAKALRRTDAVAGSSRPKVAVAVEPALRPAMIQPPARVEPYARGPMEPPSPPVAEPPPADAADESRLPCPVCGTPFPSSQRQCPTCGFAGAT